ncbi:glycogenin glucosyltransferase [Saitoella coloradoensis]
MADVYLTMVLTDNYLIGAQVLAQSLRDAGTTHKIGVIITSNLARRTVEELNKVFDYVIPVLSVSNPADEKLALLGRPDLRSSMTKINVFRQTQFRKVVYIDADVVAIRAVDELFKLDVPFAAAPDIGWPDIFNSGVFVCTPSMSTFYALQALADRGVSFDGGDQGLLNTFFRNSHRLSFTYNVTPSANYQYLPAYRHFESQISLVHFIGPNKPWMQGRHAYRSEGAYNELVARWWAVWERHYGYPDPVTERLPPPVESSSSSSSSSSSASSAAAPQGSERTPSPHFEAKMAEWNPALAPPPRGAPEAINLTETTYTNTWDKPYDPSEPVFKAPPVKPPPKSVKFDLLPTRVELPPAPVFPWEEREPFRPSRVFPGEEPEVPSEPEVAPMSEPVASTPATAPAASEVAPTQSGMYEFHNVWDNLPAVSGYLRRFAQVTRTQSPSADDSESYFQIPLRTKEGGKHKLPSTPYLKGNETSVEDDIVNRRTHAELTPAANVPSPEHWNPNAKLDELAALPGVLARKASEKDQQSSGGAAQPPPAQRPFSPTREHKPAVSPIREDPTEA